MTGKRTRALLTAGLICLGLSACSGGSDSNGVDSNSNTRPSVVLNVSDANLAVGESARLTWSTVNADSCTASGRFLNPGPRPVALAPPGEDTGPLPANGQYAYTLMCTGTGGSNSATRVITVGFQPQGVSTNLTLSPQAIQPGQSATLIWSSQNAATCNATGNWQAPGARGLVSPFGGESTGVITIVGTYTYTLTCTGVAGTTSDTETLTVSTSAPASGPNLSLSVAPNTIQPGQAATLTWTSDATAGCVTNNTWVNPGARAASGTESTGAQSAEGNVTYSLTCSNSGGASTTKSAILNVAATAPQPTTLLILNPQSITTGQAAVLSWSSTAATSCNAAGAWVSPGSRGLVSPEGGESTGVITAAGTYSYTLTCTGPGGTSEDTETLTVTGPAPPPPPTFSVPLTVTPASIRVGQSATLSWTSNANAGCVTGGPWQSPGTRAASGSESTGVQNTVGNQSYTLTCTNTGSTGTTSSATLNVSVDPGPAPTVDLMLQPTTVQAGAILTARWTSTNATGCIFDNLAVPQPVPITGGIQFGTSGQPPGMYEISLTCTGPGGSDNDTEPFTITAAPAP